jgi:hypothetical protein
MLNIPKSVLMAYEEHDSSYRIVRGSNDAVIEVVDRSVQAEGSEARAIYHKHIVSNNTDQAIEAGVALAIKEAKTKPKPLTKGQMASQAPMLRSLKDQEQEIAALKAQLEEAKKAAQAKPSK